MFEPIRLLLTAAVALLADGTLVPAQTPPAATPDAARAPVPVRLARLHAFLRTTGASNCHYVVEHVEVRVPDSSAAAVRDVIAPLLLLELAPTTTAASEAVSRALEALAALAPAEPTRLSQPGPSPDITVMRRTSTVVYGQEAVVEIDREPYQRRFPALVVGHDEQIVWNRPNNQVDYRVGLVEMATCSMPMLYRPLLMKESTLLAAENL